MLLRIFLFGLIAIAEGNDHATIMVLNAEWHDAYIAFNEATCPNCPYVQLLKSQPIPSPGVRGYDLEGYDLIFSGNQKPTGVLYSGGAPSPDSVPNANNVGDFSWTVSMPDVLNVESGVSRCIWHGASRRCNLAALLAIENGTFSTCQIVTNQGEHCADAAMYPYSFHAATTTEQSMASAVELDIEMEAPAHGDGLQLMLRKFHHGNASETIDLRPTKCDVVPYTQCVDVFINSVARADYDAKDNTQAMHFKEFYRLLDDRAKYAPVTPQMHDVGCYQGNQPACLADIPPLVAAAARRSKYPGMLDVVILDNTQNKPICPLVQVFE